jgi:hypothetical protein
MGLLNHGAPGPTIEQVMRPGERCLFATVGKWAGQTTDIAITNHAIWYRRHNLVKKNVWMCAPRGDMAEVSCTKSSVTDCPTYYLRWRMFNGTVSAVIEISDERKGIAAAAALWG